VNFGAKMYIAIMDFGAGSPNPYTVATYAQEDIIWTGGATMFGGRSSQLIDVDVKVKRRISTSQDVRLVVAADETISANLCTITGVLRGLVNTLS